MASPPDSKIPASAGGGGGAGKEKRRSFLPAPKRSFAVTTPCPASVAVDPPAPLVKLPSKSPVSLRKEPIKEEPAGAKEVIPGAEKLTVGGRILIGGVKPGILRFVGHTRIAPGFWCGIELFDATGLNDGEVDGKRYFRCKPFRGIFAPLDKVVPDEAHPGLVAEDEPTQAPEKDPEVKDEELREAEPTTKPTATGHESSRIPGPGRSQIARLSGIPRVGSEKQDRGVVKSTSADGIKQAPSKIAKLHKIFSSDQDTRTLSNSGLNTTFSADDQEVKRSRRLSADSDPDSSLNQTYVCPVEQFLKSDSRQYLNLTFNKDNLPLCNVSSNLPDVVSSASPSPPRETAGVPIAGTLKQTQSATDISLSSGSETSLGLMEPDVIADETNLLEGILADRVAPSTSESDVSLSGNSSTLDDASVATVNETSGLCLTSTPLHGVDCRNVVEDNGESLSVNLSDVDSVKSLDGAARHGVNQTLAQTFPTVVRSDNGEQRKDSSSSIASMVSAVRADLLQEEGSSNGSPEVSQVLEWDYDHDAFDGKLLEKCQDGMSTSTSDSCSEASADQGAVLADKVGPDIDSTIPDGEDIPPFEDTEDGFESIDNMEDFPLGMSKDTPRLMTDSGISEKDFLDPAGDAACQRRSVEFDSMVRVAAVGVEGTAAMVVERRLASDAHLHQDLMNGHARQERPLSLISTASADTGYVPDTDSEAGTLTTNSPTDWAERQLNASLAVTTNPEARQRAVHAASTRCKQPQSGGGAGTGSVKARETDADTEIGKDVEITEVVVTETDHEACQADITTEAVTEGKGEKPLLTDDEADKQIPDDRELAETEGEDDGERKCSEDTSSEEDEDEVGDDRPEDERVEADRLAPCPQPSIQSLPDSTAIAVSPLPPRQLETAGTSGSGDMTESVNLSVSDITCSGVVANEMTESTDPLPVTFTPEPEPETRHSDDAPSSKLKPEMDMLDGQPQCGDSSMDTTQTTDHDVSVSNQIEKKKKSVVSTADKKTVAERKKGVKTTSSSRLVDHSKTAPPPPAKLKEEKKTDTKVKKNNVGDGKTNKTASKKADNGSGHVADRSSGGDIGEEKKEKKVTATKEDKSKVKRAAPKSKWGNIMSQIEASKDMPKPRAKPEARSSIAAYVNATSVPSHTNTSPKKDGEKEKSKEKEEVPKPKPKSKLVKHPKPDFSNIKSKLNVISHPAQAKNPRDTSTSPSGGQAKDAANLREPCNSKDSDSVKESKKAKEPSPRTALQKKVPLSKLVKGKVQDRRQDSMDNWSTVSQGTGSHTDLSQLDSADGSSHLAQSLAEKKRNALSCTGGRQKHERSSSIASTKSDASTAQRSVKAMNLRNAQKSDCPANTTSQSKKPAVKSSIPPPTRRTSNSVGPVASKSSSPGPGASPSLRSKSSPPKVQPARPANTHTGAAVSARSALLKAVPTGSNQQNRSRNKAGGGLKSGQPPDVVSTSARGSRAQEVARLESLCETRTKELNYTKLQLKEGLRAFDAMACLLDHCTNHLDAFSCPLVTSRLQTAEGRIVQQQQEIDSVGQQKREVERRLQEVTGARQEAQQEVARLKADMAVAEETHTAAMDQLKEQHVVGLKALEEELTSKHNTASQQMQKCQEKQTELMLNAHKRQVAEMLSEHQMFTNQVKLAHLEEIQELRNKHDLQMEELHAQHRNKLEDITRRFESIKLSLSEKVQTLCVECDELRVRAKTSEEALQRDADVKVQLALAPYLHLPNEIESLKMVIDMRSEEIQKLRRHNMDLEKQLEELPIAQERAVSLQQKVENLQAIINIKTDHEKQLHEKCQVLMRKYDRESRANKRLSMDYEQAVWRMSQSADLTGSVENVAGLPVSRSPGRGDSLSQSSPSPVRRSHSAVGHTGQGSPTGVARRHRRVSGEEAEEDGDRRIRCRSATFSLDKSKAKQARNEAVNGCSSSPGSPGKQVSPRSRDYADLIVAAISAGQEESLSSGHESGEMSSMESSIILETSQGVSYNISVVENGTAGGPGNNRLGESAEGLVGQDEVFFMDDLSSSLPEKSIPRDVHQVQNNKVNSEQTVTVIVDSPQSDCD